MACRLLNVCSLLGCTIGLGFLLERIRVKFSRLRSFPLACLAAGKILSKSLQYSGVILRRKAKEDLECAFKTFRMAFSDIDRFHSSIRKLPMLDLCTAKCNFIAADDASQRGFAEQSVRLRETGVGILQHAIVTDPAKEFLSELDSQMLKLLASLKDKDEKEMQGHFIHYLQIASGDASVFSVLIHFRPSGHSNSLQRCCLS
jgi:hypothetical protein